MILWCIAVRIWLHSATSISEVQLVRLRYLMVTAYPTLNPSPPQLIEMYWRMACFISLKKCRYAWFYFSFLLVSATVANKSGKRCPQIFGHFEINTVERFFTLSNLHYICIIVPNVSDFRFFLTKILTFISVFWNLGFVNFPVWGQWDPSFYGQSFVNSSAA